MKAIYVKEGNELKFFAHGLNENENSRIAECLIMNNSGDSSGESKISKFLAVQQKFDRTKGFCFSNVETISDSAFKNASGVKEIFFDENLKTIKKSAFENCEDLEFFACGGLNQTDEQGNMLILRDETTENGKFTIEAFAFKKCKNLKTVILPKCGTLVIEKSAFEDCSSLRTVVCSASDISFTENPFEDCSGSLVFVCNKDSAIERFARENGYRCVNVQ